MGGEPMAFRFLQKKLRAPPWFPAAKPRNQSKRDRKGEAFPHIGRQSRARSEGCSRPETKLRSAPTRISRIYSTIKTLILTLDNSTSTISAFEEVVAWVNQLM